MRGYLDGCMACAVRARCLAPPTLYFADVRLDSFICNFSFMRISLRTPCMIGVRQATRRARWARQARNNLLHVHTLVSREVHAGVRRSRDHAHTAREDGAQREATHVALRIHHAAAGAECVASAQGEGHHRHQVSTRPPGFGLVTTTLVAMFLPQCLQT
jgi:hypothetical protein